MYIEDQLCLKQWFCFKLFCSPCSCILAEHPPEIHWQDDFISTKTLVKNTNGKSRDAGGIITLVGFPVSGGPIFAFASEMKKTVAYCGIMN